MSSSSAFACSTYAPHCHYTFHVINLLELTLSSYISLIQQWIKSHPDGIINPSLRIGREIPGDSSSLLGLFVNSQANPIEKGDIIAQIPWDQLST
jgi:hypothetical protein